MGIGDKISNKAEELAGKAKEAVGDATDNEKLQAEGKADQASAGVKQAGEHAKDAIRFAYSCDTAMVREGAPILRALLSGERSLTGEPSVPATSGASA